MSPTLAMALLQLLAQAITEAPALIADVETLLGAAKGQSPAAPQPPLQPQVDAEMATEEQALKTPLPAKS